MCIQAATHCSQMIGIRDTVWVPSLARDPDKAVPGAGGSPSPGQLRLRLRVGVRSERTRVKPWVLWLAPKGPLPCLN